MEPATISTISATTTPAVSTSRRGADVAAGIAGATDCALDAPAARAGAAATGRGTLGGPACTGSGAIGGGAGGTALGAALSRGAAAVGADAPTSVVPQCTQNFAPG